VDRKEELRTAGEAPKPQRGDPGDSHRPAVQGDRTAHDAGVGAEALAPEGVAQESDRLGAGQVVGGFEIPPEGGGDPQDLQVVRRHHLDRHPGRLAGAGQGERPHGVGGDRVRQAVPASARMRYLG
jgi:hypothetical protein